MRRLVALGLASATMVAVILSCLYAGNGLVGMGRTANAAALFVTIAVAFLGYAVVLGAMGYPGAKALVGIPRKIVGRLRGRRG